MRALRPICYYLLCEPAMQSCSGTVELLNALMSESTPTVIDNSVQIAWDYLERTGQIDDPNFVGEFLVAAIEHMVRNGERRRLALANLVIMAYERLRRLEMEAA